ncbi:MAG: transposase [Desulfobacterales bacterium]
MIRIKDHKQGHLFDPWSFLSPKRRKLLDQSWAGLFKEQILCELPVSKLAPFFSDSFGRPTKELHTVLAVLILQQALDLNDEQAIDQLAFNIQWHYALNITEESDSAKYFCPKTLWNMRSIAVENGLEALLFDGITNKLADVFKVNTGKQRIDSVHIKSNMRRLGRIGIFSKSINKFLVNLKRGYKEQFETVDKAIIDKYISEKALGCFSMVKPSESNKTLASVADDLYDLVEQFKDCKQVCAMHSYKLLERVLKEQCNLNVSDDKKGVEVKKPKDVACDSLQNPSDPDATYSGHKGQGYQLQIMETYTDSEEKEVKSKTLNLITHVEVEKACESDAQALIPAVESTKNRRLGPDELEADALYGSDENFETAKSMGVELVAPVTGNTEKSAVSLSEFEFSQKGHVLSCPQGQKPLTSKKKKTRFAQGFSCQACAKCPLVNDCPVKPGKKYYYLRYEEKAMRIAKRRAMEQTTEFKDRYRWRAGVEATMSELDRRTGVKRLRVRGFKAVRFSATLKAIGINLFRAAAVRKASNNDNADNSKIKSALNHAIFFVKEHLERIFSPRKNYFALNPNNIDPILRINI